MPTPDASNPDSLPENAKSPISPVSPKPKLPKFLYSPYGRIMVTTVLLFLLFLTAAFITIQADKYKQKAQSLPTPTPTSTTSDNCQSGFIELCEGGDCECMQDDTSDWKTYRNEDYGFQLKYPSNFFLTKELYEGKETVKISNHPDFENNEFALVITVEENINTNFKPTADFDVLAILDNIGFSDLNTQFSNFLSGNFLGDPPWGYYQVVVPSQSPYGNSILITARIHREDDLSLSEGGTGGQTAELTHQILSTFKFIDYDFFEAICLENGGRWIEEFKECEGTVVRAEHFQYGVLQPVSTAEDARNASTIANNLREIRALGGNTVFQFIPTSLTPNEWRDYLDVAQQEGFMVLVAPEWLSENPDPNDLTPLFDFMEVVSDHPALYGFAYLHEPWEMFNTSQMQVMYKEIKENFPELRLAVFWSGELVRFNSGQRQFTDGLCDICIVNMKAFQYDAALAESQGLGRLDVSARVVQEIDPDAELWSSVQIWAPPDGGRRGFRVPEPEEMVSLFCTLAEKYPVDGFIWSSWTMDKAASGTLSSPDAADNRQAIHDIYETCL